MRDAIRCFWCGSDNTHFKYIENWEEDELGNAITTNEAVDDYSPRSEVWWCDDCDGAFSFPFEDEEVG